MKRFKVISIVITLTFAFLGCQYQPKNPKLSDEWKPLTESKRARLIKRSTKNCQQYKGLDLLFDVNVTFLNEAILQDNLKKKSQYMMWSQTQARDEQSKLDIEKASKSYFFVTIYSNNKKLNQLNLKSAHWTANLLLADGSVHHGKIKLNDNLSNHNAVFFPHVESWDKNYMVTFEVSTSKLSQENFIFDITSPRGSARFEF